MNIPKHVAIIPDGNRRWALAKGKKAFWGHKKAVSTTMELVKVGKELGIEVFTLWGFSTENWKRAEEEVDYLMELFYQGLKEYRKELLKYKIKFRFLGRLNRLPEKLKKNIIDLENITKEFTKPILCIALDYGGRDEILRAVKKAWHSNLNEENLNEESFSNFLDTKGLPDPDMLIRTGGEKRLSGYLPWQSTYSELFFVDTPYPALSPDLFKELIEEFSSRTRTFGGNATKIDYK